MKRQIIMKSAFVLSATLLAAVSVYAADTTLALAAPASFFSAACASRLRQEVRSRR